jgi:PBP1b-binding outer membrane lipoprotein LpoB
MKLISLLLAAALFLTACADESDEDQIAQTIAIIEEAVESKNFTEIEKYLHSGFIANKHMGIDEVGRLLQLYSLQHKRIDVTIVGSSTTMHQNFSDRADSYVSVIVTGSSRFLPSDGSIRRVEVEWIKEADEWLIRKASWRR